MNPYRPVRDRLGLQQDLPYCLNWSAAPDFLQLVVDHCLEARPTTVLECGSGLTTLVLARCCQLNERGQVNSLEDGEQYAAQTRNQLDQFQLGKLATVRHAPLVETPLHGVDYLWYSAEEIPEGSIDLLVVDGPFGFLQKNSRFPALPVLYDRLTDGCRVYLDDAARSDEQQIVQLWQSLYPKTEHEYIEVERGCAVMTIHKRL